MCTFAWILIVNYYSRAPSQSRPSLCVVQCQQPPFASPPYLQTHFSLYAQYQSGPRGRFCTTNPAFLTATGQGQLNPGCLFIFPLVAVPATYNLATALFSSPLSPCPRPPLCACRWTGVGYFHPGRYWCHCRMVYLPMSYVYGRRGTCADTDLTASLR